MSKVVVVRTTGSKFVMHDTSSHKELVNKANTERGKADALHLQTWNSNHTLCMYKRETRTIQTNLFHLIGRHILTRSVPHKTVTLNNHYK
jgi:hypothetical protein